MVPAYRPLAAQTMVRRFITHMTKSKRRRRAAKLAPDQALSSALARVWHAHGHRKLARHAHAEAPLADAWASYRGWNGGAAAAATAAAAVAAAAAAGGSSARLTAELGERAVRGMELRMLAAVQQPGATAWWWWHHACAA